MTTLEFSDRKRLVRSALVSAAIWLVLGVALSLVSFSVPMKEERQFKSVRLTLASPAPALAAGSVPSSSVPVVSMVSSGGSVPIPAGNATQKSASPSLSPSASSKTAGKSSGQTSAKSASAKSSGGLGIPNFSAPVSSGSVRSTSGTSSGNSLDFSGSGDQRSATDPRAPKGANAVTELEGSAASVAPPSSGGGNVVRGQSSAVSGSSASGETQATLGEIAGNAKSGGSGRPGGQSSTTSNSGSTSGGSGTIRGQSSGGSSIAGLAFDGAQRKLLYPAKPAIVLPDNLAKLVDSSRSVTVSFTVRTDGSVPAGDIFFSPSAILPAEIRDYLRKEFSTWRFEKSAEDGQARFLYSIRVE